MFYFFNLKQNTKNTAKKNLSYAQIRCFKACGSQRIFNMNVMISICFFCRRSLLICCSHVSGYVCGMNRELRVFHDQITYVLHVPGGPSFGYEHLVNPILF